MKTVMFLFLFSLVSLNQATAEHDRKTEESRFGVTSLTRKNKELTKLSVFLEPYREREAQLLEKLPVNYEVLFLSTISLETTLFCMAFLYGVFHLRIWDPLCRKCVRNRAWTEELELVQTG